jgi:hypothetical protein
VKKILIQLDSDEHPSSFDAIVAYDAGVDVVLQHSGVSPDDVRDLVQGAFFTRGPKDLASMAVWVGGSKVAPGEEILKKVQDAFFGPFRVSVMLDSNGCNTTAATAIAMLAERTELRGKRAVIVGAGPVGLRSATLLEGQGCEVVVCGIPPEAFGDDRPYRTPSGVKVAKELGLQVGEPSDRAALAEQLSDAAIVLCAGPSGVPILRREDWVDHPTIEILVDYNAAEPLGVEGTEATDSFEEREGKLVLGALGIGNVKMRVHKTCIGRMFEHNDLVLDAEGVFEVASEVA